MFNSTIFIGRALAIIVAFLGFFIYPISYKSVTVVDNQGVDNGYHCEHVFRKFVVATTRVVASFGVSERQYGRADAIPLLFRIASIVIGKRQ